MEAPRRSARSTALPARTSAPACTTSGSSTMKAAPIRLPMMLPRPPMMTMPRNWMEKRMLNASTLTNSR